MTTLADAVATYKVCAKAEGLSPKTVEWVVSSMRYFAQFLGEPRPIETITLNDFRRFVLACQERKRWAVHPCNRPNGELSPHSIQTYARGIKSFFGYLHRQEVLSQNPLAEARPPKVPKRVVPTLSEREVERLLALPNKHTPLGFRDYTVLLTFVDTTARLSEVANLREGDVRLEEGYLRVVGKGNKERYLPIAMRLTKALMVYKTRYRPQPLGNDRFFLAQDGGPLTADRIRKIVMGYGKKIGIKLWPHLLRHTSATLYLRFGGDPFSLQKKLGHESLAMTRRYSHLVDADVRAAHLRSSPGDRLKL